MQRLALFLGSMLALSLVACGQVEQDSDAGPNPPGSVPPGTTPPGTDPPRTDPPVGAESTVCPSAAIDDARRVALFSARGQDLVFVRHDGSELIAHTFAPDLSHSSLSVRTNGDRIVALVAQSWNAEHAELVLFDRFGDELDSLIVERTLDNVLIDESGAIVVGGVANGEAQTLRWVGGSLVEIASGWAPIGVSGAGRFAMRAGWDAHDGHGFLELSSGTIEPFSHEATHLHLVAGKLVALDAAKENLLIHAPEGETKVPVQHPELAADPMILRVRSDGWVLVGNQAPWDEPTPRIVAVVDVRTGDARWVQGPPDPGNAIAVYCDGAREGYVASDGSVFFSKLDPAGGLALVRHPASGEAPAPIGKPLTQIAYLDVTERAGGYVVRGSDGSDTYCGAPDPAQPPAPGAEPGNSVHAGRVGSELPPRKLEFGGTWFQHTLDVSGSCVIGPTASAGTIDNPGYRIDDLVTGTSFELEPNPRGTAWIE